MLCEKEHDDLCSGFQIDDSSSLKEITTCTICYEYMFEPRMYECGHTFCLGCQLDMKFRCPLCKKSSRRVSLNFSMRALLQQLNPKAYEKSKNLYEERKLERAYNSVSKEVPKFKRERLLEENPEKFKTCCLIVDQYDYWVLQKANRAKFKEFEKRHCVENDKMVIVTGWEGSTTCYLDTKGGFFSVVYNKTCYIFF